MDHFYQNLGQDWFTYPNLYSSVVKEFDDNSHFVEVGSWKGRSSCYLAVEIENSGKLIKLDCIDTFEGSEEHLDPNSDAFEPLLQDRNGLYKEFLKNIQPVRHIIMPIKMSSLDAAELYSDNSLDFVFIDAAHDYENVRADILAWKNKVRVGGILAGHDYSWSEEVKKAVDEILPNILESEGCWIYRC